MSESASVILETKRICMWFGGVHAVTDVDLVVKQGEVHCIIGPNGAGKSTLFKVLSGQLTPTSGQVLFRGQFISGKERFRIAEMGLGIKNQLPTLLEGLSVRENLWLANRRRRSALEFEKELDRLSALFPIRDSLEVMVERLAHGQRQWVEIASVFASGPNLVLLDEPAAGMTEIERLHMAGIINKLGSDVSIVVVEHDMDFIRRIASVVTVLHEGRVLTEGTFDAVASDAMVRSVYLGKGGRNDGSGN
jgi:ABC-type uncharacterized transport system ATPase subunit